MLRQVTIHRVLWRHHLLWGGEREPVLMVTVIAVSLPLNGMNIPSAIVGALVWIVFMPILRWAAKVDPMFSKVYVRHVKYRRYYPPRSRPYRDADTSARDLWMSLLAVGVVVLFFTYLAFSGPG